MHWEVTLNMSEWFILKAGTHSPDHLRAGYVHLQ